MSKRLRLGCGALLVLACIVTYANGIGGDFTYDDKAIVRDNVRIRSPSKVSEILRTQYFGGPRGTGANYRPVLLLSYAVQWWIHGRQAESFHAVNVLLHAGATLLLLSFLRRIGVAPPAPFLAALLFAVHPIHVEAVTSLVGRGEVLAAIFSLLYLHLALRFFEPSPARARVLALLGGVLGYSLAVLTKESAASVPGIALLAFVFVGEGKFRGRVARAFFRGLPLWVGSAAALAGIFVVRRQVLGGFVKAAGTGVFELENVLDPLEPPARAVNACVVLLRYVGRIVFPLHLSADESAWSIEPVETFSAVAIAAVMLLALLAALSVPKLASRSPAAFGFLFFVLAILPASNLILPIGTVFAERLAYLPAAGLCLAAGVLGAGSAGSWTGMTARRRAVLLAVALALSARAIVRNSVWWGDEPLFLNLVRTSPDSAKAHYDLAYIWAEDRQYARALDQYAEAAEIYDGYWDAWTGKGRMEKELHLYDEAEVSYRKAIEANREHENGYFGLGLLREARGNIAGAEQIYREGLEHKKLSLPLAYRLALARSRLPWPEADEDWKRALKLGGHLASVHEGYASWLASVGKVEEARREAREALARDGGYLPALCLAAELNERLDLPFAAALAREKVFRRSRSPADWEALVSSAAKSPEYANRFRRLEDSLRELLLPPR
ncbi:MAG TPA: tetratricopeptide repeat protein [Thermoanaerobaculia bacterium]|nr:tetratricopeptide repeat protein [Thermoanaerobaculia bacterium]